MYFVPRFLGQRGRVTAANCSSSSSSSKRLHATVIRRSVGSEGRLVSLTLSVNDFEFSVTSAYCPCPSADRVRFFDSVLEPPC